MIDADAVVAGWGRDWGATMPVRSDAERAALEASCRVCISVGRMQWPERSC